MSNEEKNSDPWPSFDNLSVWYAERSFRRIKDLTVVAICIQRWWKRNCGKQPTKLYPILLEERLESVRISVSRLSSRDSILSQHVHAYEKLDGTNFGVRCDGALFGRRREITGQTYQNVCLTGVIPTPSIVEAVKRSIGQCIGYEEAALPMLVLYGELMCNPGRYDYEKRGMGKKYMCFGAMFVPYLMGDESIAASAALNLELQNNGLLATMAPESGRIRLLLNDKLAEMIIAANVECVPLVDQGPLRELCLCNKELLMASQIEGACLTGQSFLQKWKTGCEDESKGHSLLCSLLDSETEEVLNTAGVDQALLRCLVDVAGNKPAEAKRQRKTKKTGSTKEQVYSAESLDKALISAMSKYDALEAYFERDEMSAILSLLETEVREDLAATTVEETKCVTKAVRKRVGKAYGSWKRSVENR